MKKIYLFAVIFALAAGLGTYFFMNGLQHNSVVTGVEEAKVVVAMRDIDVDTVVTPDMFTTVRMPVSSITYGTLVEPSDVTGYVVTEKILRGEQVLAAKLTKMGDGKNDPEYNGEYRLSYHLQNGEYAFTIGMSDINSVAYFVRAGDYVNIYSKDPTEEVPILEKIKILEIGTYSDKQLSASGTETVTYGYVTLLLNKEQVERMMTVDEGQLRIALVSYMEGAEITTRAHNVKNEDETLPAEPATNFGMGEIHTEPPTTAASK